MFYHIDFLKFKPTVSESQATSALNQLSKLKAEIPSMTNLSFGKHCSIQSLNKGYTHALVMQFADQAGRDAYVNHPEHQRIASEVVAPLLDNGFESVIVIDYEC